MNSDSKSEKKSEMKGDKKQSLKVKKQIKQVITEKETKPTKQSTVKEPIKRKLKISKKEEQLKEKIEENEVIFNNINIENIEVKQEEQNNDTNNEIKCDIEKIVEKEEFDKDDFYKILNKGGKKGEFSEPSKILYLQTYKKLINTNLFNNGIHTTSQENIIFIMENLKIDNKEVKNPSSLNTYLNVVSHIFNYYNLPNDKLNEFKEKIAGERLKTFEENNKEKNNTLPEYKELLNEYNVIVKNAEEQIKTESPIKKFLCKYIINYLFFNFFVRNLDIDVFITNDYEEIEKRINNQKCYENTLYIDELKNHIVYRRYKYKTFNTYGSKTHIIKNQTFYKCCKVLNNMYVIQKQDGSRVSDSSFNKTVINMSCKQIGEGSIFKLLIERAQKKKHPFKEIKKMFEIRGSAVDNLFTNYDLGKENTHEEKDFLDDEHIQNINDV
jgi:hypothetical protein